MSWVMMMSSCSGEIWLWYSAARGRDSCNTILSFYILRDSVVYCLDCI